MNRVEIGRDECKGCGLCVKACPHHCIAIGTEFNHVGYQHAEFSSDKCTACGICYHICPEFGAITVFADDRKGGNP